MSWIGRDKPTNSWSKRLTPGENCMEVIQTGFYDDSQVWNDLKIWWDGGSKGSSWSTRIIV